MRLDTGDWQAAELSEGLTADGNVQTSSRRPPIPSRATGLHERDFTIV